MATYNIPSDNDDGYWQAVGEGGAFSKTGNDRIYMGTGAPNCSGWFRFTGISGLAGKVIDTCKLTLKGYGSGEDGAATNLLISMRKTAAAGQPTAGTDLDGYTYTTATRAWTGAALAGASVDSPDFANVLQEIIDAAIDPSTLLVVVVRNGGGYMVADSYTHAGGTPAILTITSHTPSASTARISSRMAMMGVA